MLHLIQEDELMVRFRQNDKRAFEQIFLLYDKDLYYYTLNRIQDRQVAEDIVSDCFYKLWVRHANFGELSSLKSFLYKTARNAMVDHWRDIQRNEEMLKNRALILPANDDFEEDERAKIESDVLHELNEEIDKIPGKAGLVFRMYYLQKMTTTEIADKMSLAEQTVLNHKQYAIRHIRTSLLRKGLLFTLTVHWILIRGGINIFL